jgi:hypothetical protein
MSENNNKRLKMKIITRLRASIILGAMFFTGSAFAYNAGNVEEKCPLPTFRNFIPAEQVKGGPVPEVDAESVVQFSVHRGADLTTVRAEVRDIKLKIDVEDRNSYGIVKIKLPPELNGKYARINLYAISQSAANCEAKDGWLIKIRKPAEASVAEEEK